MSEAKEITHSFSRVMAKQYGVNAAIVLSYIAHRIERSKNMHDGKRWFFATYKELAEHYAYLSENAVYNAVQRLIGRDCPLVTGNYNKWKRDKTTWYAFRDERTIQQLQAEPIYFKSCDAAAFGVAEAVLITNIAYWINENRKKTPDYRFHPVSPLKLAEHIPFSRSTIQRALDNLVEKKSLVSRLSQDRRKPTEYAFVQAQDDVTGCPNTNIAGPDANEAGQVFKSAQIPTESITGPDRSMTGPDTIISGSSGSITGPDRSDITTLVDNHLKDSSLKEESLKERHFKTPLSFVSSLSLPDESQSKAASGQNDGRNDFGECIVDPIPRQPDSPPSISAPNLALKSDANLSLASKTDSKLSSAPPPSPHHTPYPGYIPTSELPEIKFLDPMVHKCCWEVMNLHDNNADPMFEGLAENIVGAIEELINQTDPSLLYRFLKIRTQTELNGELAAWSSAYFAQVHDTHFATELPENEQFRELFINHAHCFLNMGFHHLRFDGRIVYCGLYYYKIGLSAWKRIAPWIEEQEGANRANNIRQRAVKYASPDQDRENDPHLSAAEKMQVFNQSLQARNRTGRYDEWGRFGEDVVLIQRNSLNLAREFFQLNPCFTPAYLNRILDECLKLPRTIDGLDPVWYAKNGYRISFLLNNLGTIAGQLNMLSQLPPFVPLPMKEEEE